MKSCVNNLQTICGNTIFIKICSLDMNMELPQATQIGGASTASTEQVLLDVLLFIQFQF